MAPPQQMSNKCVQWSAGSEFLIVPSVYGAAPLMRGVRPLKD
jgi:hypothetical protein